MIPTQNNVDSKLFNIFFIYLLLNPIFDIISCIYSDILNIQTSITPSLIIRMIALLLMLLFVFSTKNRSYKKYLCILVLIFVINISMQYVFSSTRRMFSDIQYFARYMYNILILLTYSIIICKLKQNQKDWIKIILSYLNIICLFVSFVIFFGYVTNTGLSSYDFAKIGNRGYFHSGNEISAVLITLYPISIYKFFTEFNIKNNKLINIILFFSPLLCSISMLLVGTKAALLSSITTTLIMFVYQFIKEKNQRKKIIGMLLLLASFNILIYKVPINNNSVELIYAMHENNFEKKVTEKQSNLVNYALSNRDYKAKVTFTEFKEGNILVKGFGLGVGSQKFVIEMDFFEILFYYGIIGFIIFTIPYFKRGIAYTIYFFKNINLLSISLFISLVLTTVLSFFAGHVLFSSTEGIYFAIILAIAYQLKCT